jgi:hypothetical protein
MDSTREVCEQATGCFGAGDYAIWAKEQGYPFCEVFDWTSSAGDWVFLVSQNGEEWYPMFQNNNYPHRGFTRTIDTDQPYEGNAKAALKLFCELNC